MKGPFHEDEDAMMRPKKPRAKKPAPERAFKNEAALSTAIIDKLNKQNGVKCQKIKGTAYGKPTLDILGSKRWADSSGWKQSNRARSQLNVNTTP